MNMPCPSTFTPVICLQIYNKYATAPFYKEIVVKSVIWSWPVGFRTALYLCKVLQGAQVRPIMSEQKSLTKHQRGFTAR